MYHTTSKKNELIRSPYKNPGSLGGPNIISEVHLNIEDFREALNSHDLGKIQYYWTQVLTQINAKQYSHELLSQLSSILLIVEDHLESSQSEEETQILLSIITEGYQLIQVRTAPLDQLRARGIYYYYHSFLAIDTENQRARLTLAHEAFSQLEAHEFRDYLFHTWVLFYLRLLTGERKTRNYYLGQIWDFIKQMWQISQQSEEITQYLCAVDLQGWVVADTRLTLTFDNW